MNEIPPAATNTTPARCGLAVWSLALGILALVLSVVCVGPLLAIPGVICGHKAFGRIKRSGGTMEGEGLALAGLITGYIAIALIPIMLLLSAIAVPNFIRARDTAMRNACINNLRLIDAAKQQWALETRKDASATPTQNDIAPYLLGRNGQMPTCPKGGTYTIEPVGEQPTCSVPEHELPR
jgi:hypothetical protein